MRKADFDSDWRASFLLGTLSGRPDSVSSRLESGRRPEGSGVTRRATCQRGVDLGCKKVGTRFLWAFLADVRRAYRFRLGARDGLWRLWNRRLDAEKGDAGPRRLGRGAFWVNPGASLTGRRIRVSLVPRIVGEMAMSDPS